MKDVNAKGRFSFFFSPELQYDPEQINSRKIRLHLGRTKQCYDCNI